MSIEHRKPDLWVPENYVANFCPRSSSINNFESSQLIIIIIISVSHINRCNNATQQPSFRSVGCFFLPLCGSSVETEKHGWRKKEQVAEFRKKVD